MAQAIYQADYNMNRAYENMVLVTPVAVGLNVIDAVIQGNTIMSGLTGLMAPSAFILLEMAYADYEYWFIVGNVLAFFSHAYCGV